MEINKNEKDFDSKLNSELKEKLGLGLGQTIQNLLQEFIKQLSER